MYFFKVDMQSYELCSDMIDVVIDVSCIYGLHGKSNGESKAATEVLFDGEAGVGVCRFWRVTLLACVVAGV
jgi:hypothetical protein